MKKTVLLITIILPQFYWQMNPLPKAVGLNLVGMLIKGKPGQFVGILIEHMFTIDSEMHIIMELTKIAKPLFGIKNGGKDTFIIGIIIQEGGIQNGKKDTSGIILGIRILFSYIGNLFLTPYKFLK